VKPTNGGRGVGGRARPSGWMGVHCGFSRDHGRPPRRA
jgi:hypothetical protein